MIRFFFRLLALAALSVGVIMAVLDATRSIAASAPVLTPLGESWAAVSPQTLDRLHETIIRDLHPLAWDPLALALLGLPGFVVFGILAFLFHAIGHAPPRRAGGLAR
jgi:hypothetical protein